MIWFIDSDCARYMTGDASMFMDFMHKEGDHATYGDKNWGEILGEGIMGNIFVITVDDVMLVKGLTHSLLSIRHLCDSRVFYNIWHPKLNDWVLG